jgi:Holliday junction DNA helicase RuvB
MAIDLLQEMPPENEGENMKDNDVRPSSFDEYIGQKDILAVMRRVVVAARHNDRACGHLLLAGMPGCGKTTLAQIVAAEMGSRLTATVCPAIEHKGELTAMLTGLGPKDVLFLDEIHGLDKKMQELLYTAMEDGVVDMSAGKRMLRIPLQPFTLVGATTRAHLLTGPLRDRFSYTFNLGHYSVPDLATIAKRTMDRLGIRTTVFGKDQADAIGRRSRGTPRVANRLVRACRDFMESAGELELTLDICDATFDALGIDSLGLDAQDRAYLGVLCERVGAPVGVTTIAAQLGIERGVIESIIEPVLMESGLIRRTQQGRIAMPAAVAHLQANPARNGDQELPCEELSS